MADLFDKLTIENKVEIKEFKKDYSVLREIVSLFQMHLTKEKIFSLVNYYSFSHKDDIYNEIFEKTRNYEINSKQLAQFINAAGAYQNHNGFDSALGLFLSALINVCNENNFKIVTPKFDVPINMLGYQNKKSFSVFGNVGNGFGENMIAGDVIVHGNAESHLAYRMSGGSIILNGNAKDYLGCWMESSKIIVNGNAGSGLCELMKNSEVHLNGNFGTINYHYPNTEIYRNGQLLFINGSPINRNNFDYFCPVNDDYYIIDEHPYWVPKKELFKP